MKFNIEKITAINGIHGEKIRSLMNSIQLLKKENAKLKDMNKEHKRSQLIDQLNQEVYDIFLVLDKRLRHRNRGLKGSNK